jgi:hypothetical protein
MYIEMRCKPFEYLHEPECLPAKSIQAGRYIYKGTYLRINNKAHFD